METDSLSLSICARADTGKYEEGEYSHMLSMLDPQGGYEGIVVPRKVQHVGRLMFHDLDDIEARAPKFFSYTPPGKDDVLKIMEFFQHIRANEGNGVLIHCEAGISRSTAAAMIGLCALDINPQQAFAHVMDINAVALPNRRMLRLADEVLMHPCKLADLADNYRQELFAKYEQPDPLRVLEGELNQMSWAKMRVEFLRQRGKAIMRVLRAFFGPKQKKPAKPSRFLKRVGTRP